jgi:shikimate dehydrogenase
VKRAGVIGHPIAHSRSPIIHGHWLKTLQIEGHYERFDVVPGELAAFISTLQSQGLAGINCTLPHKEAVLSLADHILPAAQAIGAANTLWFEQDRLYADNTDATGFLASLDQDCPGWDRQLESAMILGAGGAARAILHALLQRGVSTIFLVNRSLERATALADHWQNNVGLNRTQMIMPMAWDMTLVESILPRIGLLVNTSSLGMKGQAALDFDSAIHALPDHAVVSDIVYVPLETALITAAKARGLTVSPGLGMLLHQAAPGFAHWFGVMPEVTPALRTLVEADITGGG